VPDEPEARLSAVLAMAVAIRDAKGAENAAAESVAGRDAA